MIPDPLWSTDPARMMRTSAPTPSPCLPHRPGFWTVHEHEEGLPCDLSLGGCRYEAGLRLRVKTWLRGRRG